MNVVMSLDICLPDDVDPEAACDHVFNLLCSVGESSTVEVDALVSSFDGFDWKVISDVQHGLRQRLRNIGGSS